MGGMTFLIVQKWFNEVGKAPTMSCLIAAENFKVFSLPRFHPIFQIVETANLRFNHLTDSQTESHKPFSGENIDAECDEWYTSSFYFTSRGGSTFFP